MWAAGRGITCGRLRQHVAWRIGASGGQAGAWERACAQAMQHAYVRLSSHLPTTHSVPGRPQSRADAALMALTTCVLPGAAYAAVHWAVLDQWLHLWGLLLVGSAPLALVAALPNGMWWMPGPPAVAKGAARLLLVLAAAGTLAGACSGGGGGCGRRGGAAAWSRFAP